MPLHPLVTQLHFARSEFARCLDDISAEDAVRRIPPMNCMSWIVGHLAFQEQSYWVLRAQGQRLHPELDDLVAWGAPPSTPPLDEMWTAWQEITAAADEFLATLTPKHLDNHFEVDGKRHPESIGALLLRNIFHYWFHTGEAHAIRQVLGHQDLPQFVGDISQARY